MTDSSREINVSPFRLPGRSKSAVLCLHGLTGTPYDVRGVGEALSERGIAAVGPLLPGHGATPEVLLPSCHTAWLNAARNEIIELRKTYSAVGVVGLSLGGLLALSLAAEGRVDALAVIGTPLRFRHRFSRWVPLIKWFKRYREKTVGSDIRDEEARKRHPSYSRIPMQSIHEMQQLQRKVRRSLSRIHAPVLVAHGALDRTADPADAEVILSQVGSEVREALFLASSGHVATVDVDGVLLAQALADFMGNHCQPTRF